MKTYFLIVATAATLLYPHQSTAGFFDFLDMEGNYQHDMDIARLNDMRVMGGLIEEYHEKTGRYPLEGSNILPTYVHIATKEQTDSITGSPPYEHKVVGVKVFISELEKVLGRNIEIPFDPQRVGVYAPNFYIYLIDGDTFYLSIHLYKDYPFARNLGEHYNKLEISNLPYRQNLIWKYGELMADKDYVKASGKKPNKPGYVKNLRNKLRESGPF